MTVKKKLVVIGDGEVGKTCLLVMFSKSEFPGDYIPTVFESSVTDYTYHRKKLELELWDTAGQEDFDQLRRLLYTGTDIFLICFSIVSPDSLSNLYEKWIPEVRHFCPDVPIVLVGTKQDLRSDEKVLAMLHRVNQKPISFAEGCQAAEDLGAYGYVECSSRYNEGIDEVFEMAVEACFRSASANRKSIECRKAFCNIL